MPRVNTTQNSFISGEIDPLVEGRADSQQYFQAAAKIRNAFIMPQGGVRRRPGLEYAATLGTVASLTNVRMIPFRISDTRNYFLILDGNSLGTVYDGSDGSTVFNTVTHPYTATELDEVTWTQDATRLYIFHPEHRVQIIKEDPVGTWSIINNPTFNIPKHKFPDTTTGGVDHVEEVSWSAAWGNFNRYTIILDGEESAVIIFDENTGTNASNLQAELRAMAVTNLSSVITVVHKTGFVYTVTFTGTSDGKREWTLLPGDLAFDTEANVLLIHTTVKGKQDEENVWSVTRGFERSGTFFQGRLISAGSRDLPQTLWATRSGSPDDWNNRLSADDYGFEITADTDDINLFHQIHHGRHIQIFADNGEFYIPNSETEVITPNNVILRKTGSRGVIRGIPVVGVDGATLYIEASGTALREFLFTDAEAAYESTNLSFLAAHLINTPKRMSYHRSTEADTPDLILIINNDGTLAIFSTQRVQKVSGWTLCSTSGGSSGRGFVDVVDADGTMWFVTERTVGGGSKSFYLERFEDKLWVDMGVFAENVTVSIGTGLDHLNSQASKVILDNTVQPDLTPSAGTVTFLRTTASEWQVGLGWPIVDGDKGIVHIEQLPIQTDLPEGSSEGKKRRVVEVTVRLFETSEMEIAGKPVAFRDINSPLDDPIPKHTGLKNVQLEKWDDEGRVSITQTEHLPMTILSITRKVAI